MKISVQGKQVDLGSALVTYVEERLEPAVEKYFEHAIEATVTFTKQGVFFESSLSVHVGKGIMVQSRASADDIHAAFDNACERIAKQLRRYKRRLRDHHNRRANGLDLDAVQANSYVIAQDDIGSEDAPEKFEPVIVAETPTNIETLSVGEAVMRMDLADLPALMFRNGRHGGLNVVYRRTDGSIGWVDPADRTAGAA